MDKKQQFVETIEKLARMIGVKPLKVLPPSPNFLWSIIFEAEEQRDLFALAMTRSGIACDVSSRKGRHYVFEMRDAQTAQTR